MFSAWMVGFLVVMALLVWVAVVLGLPQPSIGLVVLGLLVAALGVTWVIVRPRRPPRP